MAVALFALAFTGTTALARGHGHVGIYFGPAWYPPYYYYPPYPYYRPYPYYYPPVAAAPPTYIEQGASAQSMAPGYWYYCNSSGAYYPYVKECAGGWQQVAPRPAQ